MLFDLFGPNTASQQALTILEHEARKEAARLQAIADAWSYYNGEAPKQLKVAHGQADDNVRLNVVKMVVDTSVDMLWGDDLAIGVEDAESDAGRYLDAVWERNRRMMLLGDTGTNGAVCGHVFWKIQPAPDVDPRPEFPDTLPRIVNLDPSNVRVVYDQDDYEQVNEYRITWTIITDEGKPAVRRQRIMRDGLAWVVVDELSKTDGARFEVIAEAAWPFAFAPVVHAKNLPAPNEFYGMPDVTGDLLELQDSINAVYSNARRVSRLHGHPKVWASGMVPDEALDVGPEDAIILPDSSSELGTLAPVPNLTGHLDLAARLKAAFHEQSRVPEIAAGRLEGIGQLSGLALSILYGPLVRKTEVKRRSYGAMIAEAQDRLLEVAGLERVPTVIDWPQVTPTSELDEAMTAEAKQRAGVSKSTTLAEMGYDPEQEAEQRSAERDASLAEAMTAFDRGDDEE